MNVTFGIISHKDSGNDINKIIDSIEKYAPNNKIIVIGGMPTNNCLHIPFDETIKEGWITKKKNLITQLATTENIVYMHDYVELLPNWSLGFDDLEPWDVCMSRILDINNVRFRDWVAWDDPNLGSSCIIKEKWCPNGIKLHGSLTLVPYDYIKTQYMYVSGAYFVAKRKFMLQNQFNEELCWGEGEDVEWSYRVRKIWQYKMNVISAVRFNKPK